MSALLLALMAFLVGICFKQVDAWTAFEIAVIALVGWLSVFAIGHLIHTPVLLHDDSHNARAQKQNWGFGVLGIVILMVVVSSITALVVYVWVDRTPVVAVPTADPGALRQIIEEQKSQIASLKARVPDERSLKLRSLQMANDYEQYWKKQPKGPNCQPKPGMTPEQQQEVAKPCVEFFNKQEVQYQQILAPQIMAMVAEFKAKGANVVNIENCAAMGFCHLVVCSTQGALVPTGRA